MGVLCMRSKPYGDPSMGLRWPRSERYDAQGPPWLYPQKVQSRAVTLLGERPTGQKRTQRAASLILGQPPRDCVDSKTNLKFFIRSSNTGPQAQRTSDSRVSRDRVVRNSQAMRELRQYFPCGKLLAWITPGPARRLLH